MLNKTVVLTVFAVTAAAALALQRTSTRRTPQLENDSVKVWKTLILPRQPLEMHRHENGRVIVALKGGSIRIVPQSGTPRILTWETGKAYWLPPDPPGELHGDENVGPGDIEVMVVELKR
jgi:hypothetical protein